MSVCTPPQRCVHTHISQKCSQTTTGGHTAPTLKCSPQPGLSFGCRVAMVAPKQPLDGVKTGKLGPCGPQTLAFLGVCQSGGLAIVAPPCGNHSPTRCQFDVKFNGKPRGWHPFPLILNPKQVVLLFHDQPLGLQLFGVPLNVAITFYGLRMGLQGPSNLKSP